MDDSVIFHIATLGGHWGMAKPQYIADSTLITFACAPCYLNPYQNFLLLLAPILAPESAKTWGNTLSLGL